MSAQPTYQGTTTPPPALEIRPAGPPKPGKDYLHQSKLEWKELYEQKCTDMGALDQKLDRLQDEFTKLMASNATLTADNNHFKADLKRERTERGLSGLFGSILVAVSALFLPSTQWYYLGLVMIIVGCTLTFYNATKNLAHGVESIGISGCLKRLWFGEKNQ